MIHFQPIEDPEMQIVDGDVVLSFLAGVDKAMDDAGVGQHRAFKLIANLKAMGIALKAEMPVPTFGLVETNADAAL